MAVFLTEKKSKLCKYVCFQKRVISIDNENTCSQLNGLEDKAMEKIWISSLVTPQFSQNVCCSQMKT